MKHIPVYSFCLLFILLSFRGTCQNKEWPLNRNAHRNLVGASGYGLKKGDYFYQNYWLGFNQFGYGVTDNFSINGAVELFSLFADISKEQYYTPGFILSPKFSIPVNPNKVNLSIGGLIAEVPDTDDFLDLGVLFGQITIGNMDRNFSLGLGFGFSEGAFVAEPSVTLAGNWRISKSLSLITENWWLPAIDVNFFTLGLRLMRKRLSWDFAILTVVNEEEQEEESRPIPVIGLLWSIVK